MANVLSLEGQVEGSVELPQAFLDQIRPELIQRAALAENSYKLQPQAHYVLAGMQTTATYYGAMNSFRSGRHMGIAIRPREKLGGGVQGKVRRIPSSVKGKRAHPHLAEKKIIELINKKEYQRAIVSAISATAKSSPRTGDLKSLPFIVSDEIESLKKTKEIIKVLKNLKLEEYMEEGRNSHIKKGIRRSSRRKIYKKSILIVLSKNGTTLNAARNIPGLDVCTISNITVNLLAPGGVPGRITIWSEQAVKNIDSEISKISLG